MRDDLIGNWQRAHDHFLALADTCNLAVLRAGILLNPVAADVLEGMVEGPVIAELTGRGPALGRVWTDREKPPTLEVWGGRPS